MANQLLLLNV